MDNINNDRPEAHGAADVFYGGCPCTRAMKPGPSFLGRVFSFFTSGRKEKTAPRAVDFRKKYGHFRALLTANNNALELMADMEQALAGARTFSMSFIRGHCTAVSVNVYKMIQNLQALSGGRYRRLDAPFRDVSGRLEGVLSKKPPVSGGPFVVPMDRINRDMADQVGEKMANLGEAGNRLGIAVPDGFAITASAGYHFLSWGGLQDEINRRLKTLDPEDLEDLYTKSSAIQQLIINAPLPVDLEEEILRHYRALMERSGGKAPVSMRSSALGEDGRRVSFAGQYRTHLNVGEDFLTQAYKEIVAGKYKSEAIVYRITRGYRHQDVLMCAGCLVMVEAAASGVAYSRSPADPRSGWVEISAASGPAARVVSGSASVESYRVDRKPPCPVLEWAGPHRLLSDAQASEIAGMAVRLEEHFGAPQDVEWSIDREGRLFALQSRPISAQSAAVSKVQAPPSAAGDEAILLAGGTTASRGVGAGPVQAVGSTLDILQFRKGSVLLVHAPFPGYATLVPRAAAIVSETGGAAAHLATVSREFGVPALFGLEGARGRMAEGMEVTVDATGRRVYRGHVGEVLAFAGPRPSLMRGSPVEGVLKEALPLIAPLNLTDPTSPYFSASSCKTLHDITRFCHEKAVAEMFGAGARRDADHPAAKQLVDESPYQWWVIDLDDGFSPDYDASSRFVDIKDIVSVPMRAIWQGMTAVPWAGPPPVDLRGFGSVFFRSTMTPGLEPAAPSGLKGRNYFLVSRTFCNLSVRLGYHFSLVEANVGELLTENYASFVFKGGAADRSRRFMRVRLLKETLERYGFRVEQRADSLTARIEKHPPAYLESRLKVLGYLLIHTRQIDMVMADQASVDMYREKAVTDIETILNNEAEEK